jgi:hypothetical protein
MVAKAAWAVAAVERLPVKPNAAAERVLIVVVVVVDPELVPSLV